MIKKLILCLLVAGLGWAWSGDAQATEVTLQFRGEIILSTLGDPAFAQGTLFTGLLTYDLSAPNGSDDPSYGVYTQGINFSVNFIPTGPTATGVGQPSIFVKNDFAVTGSLIDSFTVDADFAVTGSSLQSICASLTFLDSSHTVFTSASLPASFLLSDFDPGIQGKNLWLFLCDQSQKSAIASITYVTFYQTVPLPASILLFGTALGGWLVAGTIRRSKRLL
ncbi:MAG: VPLPA-CTERM sorting domain-containing protein [Desulfobaccales bacterium]